MRDILRGEEADILATARVIAHAAPDILVLTGFDHDHDQHALTAYADLVEANGHGFAHRFSARPNSGIPTGRDLDGDGRLGGPRDSHGYGEFSGQGGLAILSRLPIDAEAVTDLTEFLWADLPGALIAADEDADIRRLSTVAHWIVPIRLPNGASLDLMAWHATPPVFDGPEDLNGRRNHDETAIWRILLDGGLATSPPAGAFVIAGDANLDPFDGDGRSEAIASLIAHPRVQDPAPRSAGAVAAAQDDGGLNRAHRGDPAQDTVDWPDAAPYPGNLRVDYVLPSQGLDIAGAGVVWPGRDQVGDALVSAVEEGSRHRLVWVDIRLPDVAVQSSGSGAGIASAR